MKIKAILAGLLMLAAPVAAQAAQFTPVNFSSFYNFNPETIYGFPSGAQTFAGVPFEMTVDNNGNDAWLSVYGPSSITLPVNVSGATTVHTLMSTWWGIDGVHGASITFNGTGGATYTYDLIAGTDIRDYNPNPNTSNTVSGIAQEVYVGANGWRIDMQSFVLPSSFLGETLLSITIDSFDVYGQWATFLQGMTVETETVPAPGALLLLGLGLIGLGALKRK